MWRLCVKGDMGGVVVVVAGVEFAKGVVEEGMEEDFEDGIMSFAVYLVLLRLLILLLLLLS